MLATVIAGAQELTVDEFLAQPVSVKEVEVERPDPPSEEKASSVERAESKRQTPDYRKSIPRRQIPPVEHTSTTLLILAGYAISLVSIFFAPVLFGLVAVLIALALIAKKQAMPGGFLLFFACLFAGIGLAGTREASSSALASPTASVEMDLPTLRAATKPAVVHVIALDSDDEVKATGSGFFVAPYTVVTNFHVVEGASNVVLTLDDGTEVWCEDLIEVDPSRDLAILRAKSSGTKFLEIASNPPTEGERVAVIGSPLGFEGTLSEGIVSAVRSNEDRVEFIQISAPISPGSSGSPVVDRFGNVVGVATMVFVGGQSINFAVSGVELARVLEKLNQPTKQ